MCEIVLSAIVAGMLYTGCLDPAEAQNVQCTTRPAGDSTNACASTSFVQTAIATSTDAIATITTNTTLDSTYKIVLCDATAGNVTATAPVASGNSGRGYLLKKIDQTANTCSFAITSSGNIDPIPGLTLYSQWSIIGIHSNGTQWYVTEQAVSRPSFLSNPSFTYLPKGAGPFLTVGGVTQYTNFTAAQFTHGPGTGGAAAGSATLEIPAVGELPEGYFARVNWTGAPTNAEGRSPYPNYFSNAYHFGNWATRLAGRPILLVLKLRTSCSTTVQIIPFYSDGLGAASTERFTFGTPITVPTGGSFTQYAQIFTPAAPVSQPTTVLGSNASIGTGIQTTTISALTLPCNVDYVMNAVPLYPNDIDDHPLPAQEAIHGAWGARMMGRGQSCTAISTTDIRCGLSFGGVSFGATPGITALPGATATLWQYAISQKHQATAGSNGAGAVTFTGAAVGDLVGKVINLVDLTDVTSQFESAITVINQIQQSGSLDLSGKTLAYDLTSIAASNPSTGSPTIVEATECTKFGCTVRIGGFSGLTIGSQVTSTADFLVVDSGN